MTPKPGQFTLHDDSRPSLPAGPYTVTVSQAVNAPGASIPQLSSNIEIVAPRFALPPDQVLSTYPPNQSAGLYSTRLPQIVLRRRSLPWERTVLPANTGIPWLALVLVADGEAELKTNLPIAQCITGGDSTLPGGYRDTTIGDALYTDSSMVGWIFPRQSDLQLLAHVREVDLNDTELALGDDDGLMAVVMSNRLPRPDTHYTACLVSLEGQFNRLLPRPPDPGTGDAGLAAPGAGPVAAAPLTSAVPLIFPVLAHWSFACTGEGDFQSLVQDLDVGMLGAPPRVRLPAAGEPPPPPRRATPPEVLPTGHVALDHLTREGEPRRALYRGPFLPQPGTRDAPGPDGTLPLLHASDQAIRIGDDGRENHALSAGFEIGRLLALSEPAVVAALLLWRKDGFAQALVASLLAAEPGPAALDVSDAGRGFAARAGVELLAALGEREALGPPLPLVEPGAAVPGIDDADALAIVAEGFGLDRAQLAAALAPGGEPLGPSAAPPPRRLAGDAYAHLRAVLAAALAEGEEER